MLSLAFSIICLNDVSYSSFAFKVLELVLAVNLISLSCGNILLRVDFNNVLRSNRNCKILKSFASLSFNLVTSALYFSLIRSSATSCSLFNLYD